eukprot:SAG31_NODE_4100_length_3583_cov_6.440011_2_plen_40_part_00
MVTYEVSVSLVVLQRYVVGLKSSAAVVVCTHLYMYSCTY